MAPIKFEENIRERLEAREMQPSHSAWNKLSAQLDDVPEKKGNKFIWFAVAAAIVGALVAVSVFINDSSISSEKNDKLVKEETQTNKRLQKDVENNVFTNNSEAIPKKEVAAIEEVSEEKTEESTKVVTQSVVTPAKYIAKNDMEPVISKVMEVVKNDEESIIKKSNLTQEEIIFNTKVDKVVAEVMALQNNNGTITAEEIDALLQSAQKDIATQRILSSQKVDATALLLDVEFELERSFRDKVFDALGDGFQKIRTAVVERNN